MNRAILLTPPGAAAIAVVRLSGEGTGEFLRRHFSRKPVQGRAVHGTLSDGAAIIDDPLVVIFDEDRAADVSVHGGPWVVRRVLELAAREGFEVLQSLGQAPTPALPRSTGGGEMEIDGEDEFEREMPAMMPLAKTELALRCLMAQPAARRRWRRRNKDFVGWAWPTAAEEGGQCPPYGRDRSLYWLLHPPTVAIVGPPNVGKSTLANQLFAQERSITADLPGTTRDWVGEIADLGGLAVFLMDTPGQRESDDAIEQAAIAASGEAIRRADLIVLVVDATQSIAEQREWVWRYPRALVVRNKCDCVGRSDGEIALGSSLAPDPHPNPPPEYRRRGKEGGFMRKSDCPGALEPIDEARPHVHTVANRGEGIDALRQAICREFMRRWRHARRAMAW